MTTRGSRSGLLSFFLVGGGVMALIGLAGVTTGTMGGSIAGGTFLMIGVIWIAVALGVSAWYQGIARKSAAQKQLFETGTRATAVIESVEQTGTYINNMPSYNVVVRVEPKFGAPFTHETRLVTLGNGVPIPGYLVEVGYDPTDTSQVAFETRPGLAIPPGEVWVMRPPDGARGSGGDAGGVGDETDERLDALERLGKLRDTGVLSEAEFEAEKARLLGS